LSGALVIVDKSASPLDFETLHVKYIEDDRPTVVPLATMNRPPTR
jgi:hypothetical protein